MDPAIPPDWPGFEMTYRRGAAVYEIAVRRRAEEAAIELDGEPATARFVKFDDKEGTRRVTVWIPAPNSGPALEVASGLVNSAEPSLTTD
jgi:cellobiose phosphorylase